VSKTLTAAITSHIAGRSHTRCNMLLLDLIDGTTIGITDHDKPIDYDIGDGTVTYDAGTGILTSNVSMSCGLDADNYEVTGPVGDTVTLDGVLGGRFDRARARLFEVNWKNLTAGAIKILSGYVSEARIEGGRFIFEIRSDMDFYNQTVGRVITNQCDADFGDARCGATPTTVVGTIAGVVDAMQFAVSYSGSYADDFFNMGTVIGLTGANTGTTMEILDWNDNGDGTAGIILYAPLVQTPTVGDTFTVKSGCSKLRMSSDASVPTCLTYNNVVNFRGYPEVPGSDQVLKMPIPGGGGN
jgi:uncharacterized phage protein (TIGR02218 family)